MNLNSMREKVEANCKAGLTALDAAGQVLDRYGYVDAVEPVIARVKTERDRLAYAYESFNKAISAYRPLQLVVAPSDRDKVNEHLAWLESELESVRRELEIVNKDLDTVSAICPHASYYLGRTCKFCGGLVPR